MRRATLALLVLLTAALAAVAALPAFGGRLLVVGSGSMRPAIEPGDALVVAARAPEDVAVGDVITYQPYGGGPLVTHRVVGLHPVDGTLHFLTQGDANEHPDRDAAPSGGLVGAVWLRLPRAGWILQALASDLGRLLTLGLPATVLITLETRALWRRRRHRPLRRRRTAPALTILDRHGPQLAGPIAALAGTVLFLGVGQLLSVQLGWTSAVFTDQVTVANSTVATVELVPPASVSATFDCGTLGLGKGILVEWDPVGGADGYEVARSTTSGGPYTTLGSVDGSTTSYFDDTVQDSTTYYYVVRTIDGEWTSEDSTQASETTPSICLL